jgi:alcohol dehydrogenase
MRRPSPYAETRPLEIAEVELDGPGHGEVLVRIRAAGLCHSDLSVIDGSRPRVMPMLLGHEAAGEVVELGEGVETLRVGDHVVLAFVPSCGRCGPCLDGRAALCEPGAAANAAGTLLGGTRRLRDAAAEPLHHHLGVSGFAEAAVVNEHSAIRIDPELPYEVAALFGCAVLTGVGAALYSAQVRPGQSVAIFGLGGVGLSALLGARLAGAAQIVAVDVVPDKLSLAASLGATDIVRGGPDAVAELRELTGGGAERVIETAGRASVLAQAYAATRRGGVTVTVGLPPPDQELAIPAVSLVAEEKTLRGSYLGSAVPARDIPRLIALHRSGQLPVERLLTDRLPLEEINRGFDRLAEGHAVRQAVIL